ncbi:MAG TPA: O-antigen ligase family protein [Humisphaera sp.]|nr:O-antigen ligase family protein [Humisphaera sp.]
MTISTKWNSPQLLGVRSNWRGRLGDRFLLCLGLVLMGYAVDGRGFAYVGIPPLFVGEATMLAGIAILLCTRNWAKLWEMPQIIALSAFVALGIARTIPYVDSEGIDAIRDGAIYYYSAFAFVVAGLLIADPRRLATLIGYYRKFARAFLLLIPIIAIAYRFGHEAIPHWPGGDVPMIQEKEGDVMVHLGGIVAFWMSGLAGPMPSVWSIVLAGEAACMGVIDRAGLVAFTVAMLLGMAHNPRGKIGWKMIGAMAAAVVLLAISNFHVEIPGGKGRELSFQQIVINVKSTFGDAGNDGLDSTKEWRTDWWKDIIADTIHGKRFWTGGGFGLNLADEYGYQVQQDHSLRSPHSAHMTVLARMGVPGLVLWAAVQLTWLLAILDGYYRSRRNGDKRWSGLFLFLGAFFLAFLINGSFDVYLEGPMGGIWFWTVYGIGIGALRIYKRNPETLYPDMNDDFVPIFMRNPERRRDRIV